MSLSVIIVPCLIDNYAYLIRCEETGHTAVIDVPDAYPISNMINELGWKLNSILITHHHSDHVDGVEQLQKLTGANVIGAKSDSHRLPNLNISVSTGDIISIGNQQAEILNTPGHTIGHISYFFKDSKKVFTGDSLMSLGCGRLFEGTHKMMWNTLKLFMKLPKETLVYSGHEYSYSNAKFALSGDVSNSRLKEYYKEIQDLLKDNKHTVPTSLELEFAINPFLRSALPEFKSGLDMCQKTDQEVFQYLRILKDNF